MLEPRPSPFETRDPVQIAAVGLLFVFVQQLLIGVLEPVVGLTTLRVGIGVGVSLIGLPLFLLRREGGSAARVLRIRPIAPGQVGWTVLLGLALVLPVNTLGEWNSQWVHIPNGFEEAMLELLPRSPLEWVLAVVVLCVLVPIGEEIVFRGIIQQAARVAVGPRASVVLIGVLFALLHLQPWLLLGLVALGLALGAVFERTRSLTTAMILHATYNASVLVAQTWGQDKEQLPTWLEGTRGAALSSLGLGIALYSLSRLRRVERA